MNFLPNGPMPKLNKSYNTCHLIFDVYTLALYTRPRK